MNIVLSIHCCQTSLTCLHSILHLLQCCMPPSPSVFTFTMYNFTPPVPRSSGRSESEILKDTNTKKNARVHAFHILDIYLFTWPGNNFLSPKPRAGGSTWWLLAAGGGCWRLSAMNFSIKHNQTLTLLIYHCAVCSCALPRVLLLVLRSCCHPNCSSCYSKY